MKKLENVLVSTNSFDDNADAYTIIGSNISTINAVLEQGGSYELIAPEALQSYFVDYYADQMNRGNFSQFVYNSRWNLALNNTIKEGLQNMGAKEQLAYFESQEKLVLSLSADELAMYFESQSEEKGENQETPAYFKIYEKENLVNLNSQWLRQLPNLKVLSTDGIYEAIEELLGRKIEKR